MQLDDARALVADDTATPEELAVAVFGQFADYCVIAAATAHQTAAVESVTGPVALSAVRAERAVVRVSLAEIRRLLEIDQVLPRRPLLRWSNLKVYNRIVFIQ